MNTRILILGSIAAPLLMAGALPAGAAKSPAMESCSAEWAKMKSDKTVPEGLTWPKFWSQCSKDYAAAHATDTGTTTTEDATAAPDATKTKKASKTAINEDEPTGSSGADKKACDAKWHDYKTSSGAHGWKPYFTFMAKCMP
jgi:hypothetical protein